MIWPYALAVIAGCTIVLWHLRPLTSRQNRSDLKWKPTGYTVTTDPHYDEAKAIAAVAASKTRSPTGRRFDEARRPLL